MFFSCGLSQKAILTGLPVQITTVNNAGRTYSNKKTNQKKTPGF